MHARTAAGRVSGSSGQRREQRRTPRAQLRRGLRPPRSWLCRRGIHGSVVGSTSRTRTRCSAPSRLACPPSQRPPSRSTSPGASSRLEPTNSFGVLRSTAPGISNICLSKMFGSPCLLGFENFLMVRDGRGCGDAVGAPALFDHMLAGKCHTSSCQAHSGGAVPPLRGAPTRYQRCCGLFSLLIPLLLPVKTFSNRANMDVP